MIHCDTTEANDTFDTPMRISVRVRVYTVSFEYTLHIHKYTCIIGKQPKSYRKTALSRRAPPVGELQRQARRYGWGVMGGDGWFGMVGW